LVNRSRRRFLAAVDVQALLTLIGQLPEVSFFLKDRAGRFIALNRRGCDYCGVKDEAEAIGRTDRDFFPRRRAEDYMRDESGLSLSITWHAGFIQAHSTQVQDISASPRHILDPCVSPP